MSFPARDLPAIEALSRRHPELILDIGDPAIGFAGRLAGGGGLLERAKVSHTVRPSPNGIATCVKMRMAPANRLHSSDRLSGQARGGDAPLWGRVNGSADWPRRGRRSGAVNLTLAEAAMLVGLIHAPSRLAPTRSLDMARARADTVLAAMVETGAITEAQGRRTPANLFIPASLPQHL